MTRQTPFPNAYANLVKSLESLAHRLYTVTRLQDVELTGTEITGVISAMNERYAKRLGIDPGAIEKAHRAAADAVRSMPMIECEASTRCRRESAKST